MQKAQKLDLGGGRDLSNLVEKESAPGGLVEAAFAPPHRARESALLMAEKFAFEEVFRERGAMEFDEWFQRPWTVFVDGLRDQLLARSALSRDQDTGSGGRDLLDDVEDFLHRGTRADDVVETQPTAQARPKLDRFVTERASVERPLDDEHELIDLRWFRKVVLRAALHRPHRGFDVREARDEHDDEIRGDFARAREELQSVEPGHLQIGDENVRRIFLDLRQRFGPILGDGDVEALRSQKRGQSTSSARFVVGHEDPRPRPHLFCFVGHAHLGCTICAITKPLRNRKVAGAGPEARTARG